MLQRISILVLYAGVLAFNCWRVAPVYNWDLIGYVGASQILIETDPQSIHRKTFAELKAQLPKSEYDSLTADGHYSVAISNQPEILIRQIPFYSIKPAYPALMLLLNFAGLSLVTASLVISKAAYVGVGSIVFYWLSRYFPPLLCLFFATLISSYPYLVYVAGFSSPDLLSALFILLVYFLLIETRSFRLPLGLLVLAITVRPDNLLLLFPVAAYFFRYRPEARSWTIASAFAGCLLYSAIGKWAGQYPWTTLFYHSFVQRLVDPSTFVSTLSFGDYLDLYLLATRYVTQSSDSLVFFVPLSLYLMWAYRADFGESRIWFRVIAINNLFMLTHWLIYPKEKDRTLEASFLFLMLALAMAARPTLTRVFDKLGNFAGSRDQG